MPASNADHFDTDAQGIDYVRRARELAPELAAAADEIERRRELPEPVVDALFERGFYRLLLPRSLGGAELLPARFVPVIEEIAKADASTAWCLNQASGCSMTAAYLEPAAACEIFGGLRGILAWGPGPGSARIVEGGYRVTASWSFASGSHNATWLGCHVPIVEANGTPRLNPDGSPVVQTMLFPKSNARMTEIWHVIGLKGTGSNKFSVEDLFVPQRHTATRDDETSASRVCSIASAASSSMPRGLPGGDGDRPQHARRLCRARARQGAVPFGWHAA
jgi:indole-3-acetate monooxygenase